MVKKSLDEIAYDLDLDVESEVLRARIVKTVQKLPDEVYGYVIENIEFADLVPKAKGFMIPRKEIRGRYLVVLRKNAPKYTIAHEIAHCYLKHSTKVDSEGQKRHEKEAEILALGWLRSLRLKEVRE